VRVEDAFVLASLSQDEEESEMKKWQKLVALPAIGVAVMFSAMAPTIASADTDQVTDRATTDRITDRESDRAEGRVELREPHTLEARGRGDVALAGGLTMTGIAYGYSVTVTDLAGDAEVRVSARAHRVDDAGNSFYRGLNGEFSISGSDVIVKFHRVGIHFDATGHGRAALNGQGWFKLDDGRPQRWGAF